MALSTLRTVSYNIPTGTRLSFTVRLGDSLTAIVFPVLSPILPHSTVLRNSQDMAQRKCCTLLQIVFSHKTDLRTHYGALQVMKKELQFTGINIKDTFHHLSVIQAWQLGPLSEKAIYYFVLNHRAKIPPQHTDKRDRLSSITT